MINASKTVNASRESAMTITTPITTSEVTRPSFRSAGRLTGPAIPAECRPTCGAVLWASKHHVKESFLLQVTANPASNNVLALKPKTHGTAQHDRAQRWTGTASVLSRIADISRRPQRTFFRVTRWTSTDSPAFVRTIAFDDLFER